VDLTWTFFILGKPGACKKKALGASVMRMDDFTPIDRLPNGSPDDIRRSAVRGAEPGFSGGRLLLSGVGRLALEAPWRAGPLNMSRIVEIVGIHPVDQ